MMFCKRCGSQIDEGAGFCKKCGSPVENSNQLLGKSFQSNAKLPIFIVLGLQILQLVFFFIPVYKVITPRYGEIVTYKIGNVLAENRELIIDYVDINYNKIVTLLSIIAIVSTVFLIFRIYKISLVGHIIRFISWGMASLFFVAIWNDLIRLCQMIEENYGVVSQAKMTFAGVLYHLINILLFISLVALVRYVKKQKAD